MNWESKPLAIYALTSQGADMARKLAAGLPASRMFLPENLAQPGEKGFERLAPTLAANFKQYPGHVLVAATGIVVRALAPLLEHKTIDPAVVVVDQRGQYVISLLSGHLGGANDLAREAAGILGGQAVITTATDVENLPSLELLARELGLAVQNLGALSKVSGRLLAGGPVLVHDPGGWLLPALASWPGRFAPAPADLDPAQPLVWVGWTSLEPPPAWLVLRPRCLAAGMGLNRGAPQAEARELLRKTLADHGLSGTSLMGLASIEAKQDEEGLLALGRSLDLDITFYSAKELSAVQTPNPSQTVQKHVGAPSVCEAAAILLAKGGRLLASKQKSKNVTLALALLASST